MTLGLGSTDTLESLLARYAALGLRPIMGGDGSDDGSADDASDDDDESTDADDESDEDDDDDSNDGDSDGEDEDGDKSTSRSKRTAGTRDRDRRGQQAGKRKPAKVKVQTFERDGVLYVRQEDANQLVGQARTEGHAAGKAERDRELQDARDRKRGNFEQIAQRATARAEKAERELAEAKLERIRSRLGREHGLPDELWDRLKGSTEQEIAKDAKRLATKLGAKRRTVRTDAGGGSRPTVTGRDSAADDDDTTDKPDTRRKTPQKRFAFQQPGDVEW